LGLFSEDPEWSYEPLLREIAALGATHVELVYAWYLRDGTSDDLHPHPRYTAPPHAIGRAARHARALGLKVALLPILRLEDTRGPHGWRGALRPRAPATFWRSYTQWMVQQATLARDVGATLLAIGSELSSLDGDPTPWRPIAAAVRRVFSGALVYSANFDHYQAVGLWPLVDYAGVSSYFELESTDRAASVDRLAASWGRIKTRLVAFQATVGKPLLFTELGYLSQDGTALWPWKEQATEAVDLEEQRRCFAAFIRTWRHEPALAGVYVWNWYGWGGPTSRGYTPRGKPAAEELRRWYRER
jgi:hypothetical protein